MFSVRRRPFRTWPPVRPSADEPGEWIVYQPKTVSNRSCRPERSEGSLRISPSARILRSFLPQDDMGAETGESLLHPHLGRAAPLGQLADATPTSTPDRDNLRPAWPAKDDVVSGGQRVAARFFYESERDRPAVCQGPIDLLNVVMHHAMRAEGARQRLDRALHALQPRMRQSRCVAEEVQRHDLVLQEVHQLSRFGMVADVVGNVLRDSLTESPAETWEVRFSPPAIELTHVQRAIERGLHTTGSTSLHRTTRRVQPHVASLDEKARQIDIVVTQKGDPAAEPWIVRRLDDRLDKKFAWLVPRVRLT